MTSRIRGKQLAVGYASTPWRYIEADQISSKVRVWNQDQLIARGTCVYLWQPASSGVQCTCYKDTTKAPDRSCLSCFGTSFLPGYHKFLHDGIFFASAESDLFTLVNTQVLTNRKTNLLQLSPNALSGSVVSQAKAFSAPAGSTWDVRLEGYQQTSGDTVELDVSTNAGSTWTPVTLIQIVVDGIVPSGYTGTVTLGGTGNVLVRVRLTRVVATTTSPMFEIVRFRRIATERISAQITRRRPDYIPGTILLLRPWTVEQHQLEASRGLIAEHAGAKSWTAPLDFFDTSLTTDTPATKIYESSSNHPFYEYARGVQVNTRYVMLQLGYNEQFGRFTQQSLLIERRAQDAEAPYSLIC